MTKFTYFLKISISIIIIKIFLVNAENINATKNLNYIKRLPQAIIIGAKKCGTRALLKFIGAHPNVSTAGAELHFFDRFYHMGIEWYKDQMPYSFDDQITIEKTPKYLVDRQVPERVYKMNPNIKLIVVLRNPVTRAISEYVQGQWRKKRFMSATMLNHSTFTQQRVSTSTLPRKSLTESQKFEQMVYDKHFKNHTIKSNWPIIRNGIYYQHLKLWLKYFPFKNFLFVNGEQLVIEPSVELDKLQTFLNLNPIIKKHHFVQNKQKGFACIFKPLDSDQVRCLSDQKGRKHPIIDQAILNDLRNFYKPYNQQLFKLFNVTDPWWPI